MYLPGQADEIAILADTLTSVRKRNSEGNFQTATIASYGPTVALQACDVSHDGSLAVTISDDLIPSTDEAGRKTKAKLGGEVRIWKVTNSVGERIGSLKLPDAVRSISINPKDSNLILVSGNLKTDGKGQDYCAELYRWNGKTFDKLQSLGHHEKWISRSRFSADGHKIVTASVNGQVQIFESNEGKYELAKSFDLKTDNPKLALDGLITADLSDDGKLLLVADRNGALVLDVQTGEPIIDQLIQGHSNDLTDVRFATRPSDMADAPIRIWTASLDGNVKFWGLGAAEEKDGHQIRPVNWLLKLSGHQQGVLGLAALPNGGVVTAGKDGQVILWPIAETTN